MPIEAAIAVHRYGLGARPGEMAAASADPRGWLLAQLHNGADQPQPLDSEPLQSGAEITKRYIELVRARRDARMDGGSAKKDVDAFKEFLHEFLREMSARFALGFTTQKPFAERLVWFWSNHFAVSAQSAAVGLAGPFEREAIRPHIAGTFEDMLVASTKHPAMLVYLSNAQSIGPDSLAGLISGKGLNENLGREIMELHTLGVNGGYAQADVIAMAKLLTGWSLDADSDTGFGYYHSRHEPGEIVLRGKSYPSGEDGGMAALHDLARDPATANHIARKFAAYFVADAPPQSLVDSLAKNFRDTGGNLAALGETLLKHEAAFAPPLGKMREPVGYITATYRLMGWPRGNGDRAKQVAGAMAGARMLGEFPLAAPSPQGWPDKVESWSGPNSMLNRIDWARAVGEKLPDGFDAAALAEEGLGPLLNPATLSAMKSAKTSGEAVALLISSPEFQRR